MLTRLHDWVIIMNRNFNQIAKFALLAGVAGLCASAHAQFPITGTLDITSPNDNGAYWQTAWPLIPPGVRNSYGGPFGGVFSSIANPDISFPTLYCISTTEDFNYNSPFAVTLTDNISTRAGWLVDNVAPIVSNSSQAVGLQLAIWQVTGQYSHTEIYQDFLASGGWHGADTQTYKDYLGDVLASKGQSAASYTFSLTAAGGGQPQIAPEPQGGGPFIQPGAPGPAAVIPFALGLVGRVRRRNKARRA
jgi:hypothetical protein